MIVFCILRQAQSKVSALALINSDVFAYIFMNKSFTQQHRLFLHLLTHSRRLWEFDDQVALIDDITHVVEFTMILDEHVKKLFFYVTELNQYLIIMSLSWLHHHFMYINFEHNTLVLFSLFCLSHCCQFLVKIYNLNRSEENLLFEAKEVASTQFTHKKQFNLQFTFKEQFSSRIIQEESFSSQFALKKQFNSQFALKKQFSSRIIQEESFSTQLTYEKQFSSQFAQKKQLSFSSVHKKQISFSFVHHLEQETSSRIL